MKILSIETSCDETAIAILECSGNFDDLAFEVLGNTLLSQALKHAEFGGIYPNLAKRLHSENLIPILTETLKEAELLEVRDTIQDLGEQTETIQKILEREPSLYEHFMEFIPAIEKPDIDALAVTQGPGLEPALWVGLNFAKALALVWDIPLIPTNHMEGHIVSVLMNRNGNTIQDLGFKNTPEIDFPAVALLISGGHTELVLTKEWLHYELIGRTRDDAVGEAFDKVARILGLPYPGGPEISKLAELSRERTETYTPQYDLPAPMLHSKDFDFSFSGLKTAVLYLVQKLGDLTQEQKEDIAREFEDVVVKVLIHKTKKALEEYGVHTLIIGGGVIASTIIRRAFTELIATYSDINLCIPEMSLTTDNAVMIGIAGYLHYIQNPDQYMHQDLNLKAHGRLRIEA